MIEKLSNIGEISTSGSTSISLILIVKLKDSSMLIFLLTTKVSIS